MGEPSWPSERHRVKSTAPIAAFFGELCSAISVGKRCDQSCQPMAYKYFRKTRKFTIAAAGTGLLKLIYV
jgi:hypothetical protein